MIYSHKEIGAARCTELEADYEEVAASCGHFSFSLQEFGEQLRGFLELLDLLQVEVDSHPMGKTWNWLRFWMPSSPQKPPGYSMITSPLTLLEFFISLMFYREFECPQQLDARKYINGAAASSTCCLSSTKDTSIPSIEVSIFLWAG